MKKYILFIVFALVSVPSFVFASWWNPLSWHHQPVAMPRVPVVEAPVVVPVVTPPIVVKKKPKKIVTKKPTALSPELQQILNEALEDSRKVQALDELQKQTDADLDAQAAQQHADYQRQIQELENQNKSSASAFNEYQSKLDQAEQDIRNEIKANGGFGTDSQILEMAIKRVGNPPVSSSTSLPHALCNDGTASYSENRSGTCSYHGGVSSWIY